ncbi:MAG: hypothetical protein IT200_01380 [Thermoleophilia bacterium]|nr:hypothetical protein [Thermoleophilia bacterium]
MRRAALAAPCLALLAWGAAPAAAQAPTAPLEKWNEISAAALTGTDLLALDTETVRVRRRLAGGGLGPVEFTYHKTDLVGVGLAAGRRRFTRAAFDTRLAIRNSIGSQSGARLATGTDGASVVLPGAHGFAPPVVWCCPASGIEVVVESDGRSGAQRALAAGLDGTRVRMLMRSADGDVALVSASPGLLANPDDLDESRTAVPFAGRPSGGLAAIADGVVAWTEDPATGVVRHGAPADTGVTDVADTRFGGRVLRVWAAPGTVAALVRTGRVASVRTLEVASGTVRTVWRGTSLPRVAVGGGAVAVADGRRILAARAGPVARVAQARGPVAAIAVDGDRVAWFERVVIRRGGKPGRWTVARLARVTR